MDKKLLTTQETAKLLGISDARVRRMILDDKLTATKFGKLNMIKRTDAEKVKVYGKAGRPPKVKKPETVKDAPKTGGYSVRDAAKMVGVSHSTMTKMVASGLIRSEKFGGTVLVNFEDVKEAKKKRLKND